MGRAGDGDGWVRCRLGHRHWGRHGAAGLLLRDGDRVVLQHRAWWSHQGGTWGVPGGARDSAETVVEAALRETGEEAGIDPADVRPTALYVDDHGDWSYTTVVGRPRRDLEPRPTGGESEDVRWVAVDDVGTLPLHPGFAASWPRLRDAPPPLTVVVDAANVVGARGAGDGWWRDRAGAATRLLTDLAPLATAGIPPDGTHTPPRGTRTPPDDGGTAPDRASTPPDDGGTAPDGARSPRGGGGADLVLPRFVVVLEGAARPAEGPAGVEVVRAPGSGDDTIVEVAGDAARTDDVLVVTADRGLRERVGVRTVGPTWLIALLDGR